MHKLQLGPAGNAVDHERVMALAGLYKAPNLRTVYMNPVQDTPTVIEGLARPRMQALAKSEAYQPPNSPHLKNHRVFEKNIHPLKTSVMYGAASRQVQHTSSRAQQLTLPCPSSPNR